MQMYELRGLPVSSVVFIAWSTFASLTVDLGHMLEFRRVLMQPVYVHVHYAMQSYADSTEFYDLCMVCVWGWGEGMGVNSV